jgi:hypothetical protein
MNTPSMPSPGPMSQPASPDQVETTSGVPASGQPVSGPGLTFVKATLVIVGGGLLIAGSFMPWVSATVAFTGTVSRNGMGGDGIVTLVAGLVLVLLGVLMLTPTRIPKPVIGLVPILAGLAGLGVVAANWSEVQDRVDAFTSGVGEYGVASVGSGLYVLIIGGVISIIAGILEVAGELSRRGPARMWQ